MRGQKKEEIKVKKKIIITVSVILSVFIIGAVAATLFFNSFSISVSTGSALLSENGTLFLVKRNSPVRLSFDSGKAYPENIGNGDSLLVIHNGVNESYPASTLAYFVVKTADGELSDIPEEVISSMKSLGWLGDGFGEENSTEESLDFKVKYIKTALPEEDSSFPSYLLIEDSASLDEYKSLKNKGLNEDFYNAVSSYNDEFFLENSLFVAHIEEGSGSNSHKADRVLRKGNETAVYIDTVSPEVGTCDMAYHHILVELKKSDIENTEVRLYFNGKKILVGMKSYTFSEDYANFSISLPENWDYEELSDTPDKCFGISIFEKSSPESTVTIEFSEMFGVCGTGLRTEGTEIGGYEAHMGIYDSNPTFDYIVFEDTPGFYVIKNNADILWWRENKEEITEILSTLKIAEGIVFRSEAVEIAKKEGQGEYKREYCDYDCENGLWNINFIKEETEQIVKIDKSGNIVK